MITAYALWYDEASRHPWTGRLLAHGVHQWFYSPKGSSSDYSSLDFLLALRAYVLLVDWERCNPGSSYRRQSVSLARITHGMACDDSALLSVLINAILVTCLNSRLVNSCSSSTVNRPSHSSINSNGQFNWTINGHVGHLIKRNATPETVLRDASAHDPP